MTEPHTADLATRYRYRKEGALQERERIIAILKKIKDYECRCSCDCHDEFPPCITCQAHNEVVEMIRGEK